MSAKIQQFYQINPTYSFENAFVWLFELSQENLEDDRKNSLFRKEFQKTCLRAIFGRQIEITYNDKGKPFLSSNQGLSISHTKRHLAILVSENPSVGIDLEEPRERWASLVKKVFTLSERTLFNRLSEKEQKDFFFWAWCTKEAVYKSNNRLRMLKDIELRAFPTNRIDLAIQGRKTTAYKFHYQESYGVVYLG